MFNRLTAGYSNTSPAKGVGYDETAAERSCSHPQLAFRKQVRWIAIHRNTSLAKSFSSEVVRRTPTSKDRDFWGGRSVERPPVRIETAGEVVR